MSRPHSRRLYRKTRSAALLLLGLTSSGCLPSSVLITPVSSRQRLAETVLSRDSLFAFPKIALIDVSGIISNSPSMGLFGAGDNPVSLLLEQLDEARRDALVKAVILRINSPGGTAVASELMHDEIVHFKKSGKPVIAVMMDVAASGGYYIACACDEIVAQPSTVTGSIGVIMRMFDVSGTMDMIGVRSDAIISGPRKDSGSPLRGMRPEERELFQAIVWDMYERFVKVVADGRPKLDENAVRSLADGRVYTAGQALELGLIDRIATMREVIDSTKQRVGTKRIRLIAYKRPHEYRANYYARSPQTSGGGDLNLLNFDLPPDLLPSTPQFLYLWAPGS